MKKSVENTEHYYWGASCSGWHLVKTDELSVIQELMPAGTEEERHFHKRAQQFFYILSGIAVLEVEGEQSILNAQNGLLVKPGLRHQIRNETSEDLHFLVISQPGSRGDRFIAGDERSREINFHNRFFKSSSNTANGEVGTETIFHYRQKGRTIWATYEGGSILFGTLSGRINSEGKLEFTYQHRNLREEFMSGTCISTPELLPDGRIRLKEQWQWTCSDFSMGESELEEISI